MESSIELSNNLFESIDNIFKHHLCNNDSTIEYRNYIITITNITYKPKERFIINFVNNKNLNDESRGRLVVDSDNNIDACYPTYTDKTQHGTKFFYRIDRDEMIKIFTHLKRIYNLDELID